MTPERFRFCLNRLGWSQTGFAEVIRHNSDIVRKWARGKLPIPHQIVDWLEDMTAKVDDLAPPGRQP